MPSSYRVKNASALLTAPESEFKKNHIGAASEVLTNSKPGVYMLVDQGGRIIAKGTQREMQELAPANPQAAIQPLGR
jgi:hypothetical protein